MLGSVWFFSEKPKVSFSYQIMTMSVSTLFKDLLKLGLIDVVNKGILKASKIYQASHSLSYAPNLT